MEHTENTITFVLPLSDGLDFTEADRDTSDSETVKEDTQCTKLIGNMLREEYEQDNKLDPSTLAINNVPRHEFPFNRHTVTIGIGNEVIDFQKTWLEHTNIKEEQTNIANEIEKLKEEMEKVRIIEKAWYDDYLNEKYINDLSAGKNSNISRGIGDACVIVPETYKEKFEDQLDIYGILHVRNKDFIPAVKPKGRYLTPFEECVESLPNASM